MYNLLKEFYIHWSVHRESMSIIVQQNATIYSLLYTWCWWIRTS